jgi:hypothetical protein
MNEKYYLQIHGNFAGDVFRQSESDFDDGITLVAYNQMQSVKQQIKHIDLAEVSYITYRELLEALNEGDTEFINSKVEYFRDIQPLFNTEGFK